MTSSPTPHTLGAFLYKGDSTEPINLAIVGSCVWTPDAAVRAARLIEEVLDRYKPHLVISGGAEGVDTWAADAARHREIPVKEHLPENPRWEPKGYAARNLLIAWGCTHLVCITSPVTKTYGSGWTANKAEELGRPVERHRIPLRYEE